MKILYNLLNDFFKCFIYFFFCREFRVKLILDVEKELVMMFGWNFCQFFLISFVLGCILMGVDFGYKYGCKLVIIFFISQIFYIDVVYLYCG